MTRGDDCTVQLDDIGTMTRTFGLNLPVGPGQNDVPRLLEHLADTLRHLRVRSESVMGITLQYGEVEGGELLPGFLVTIADDESGRPVTPR